MERDPKWAPLVTGFYPYHVPAGLQGANGGFLILHIADLLQHPMAGGLLRGLCVPRGRRLSSLEAADGAMRTKPAAPAT